MQARDSKFSVSFPVNMSKAYVLGLLNTATLVLDPEPYSTVLMVIQWEK
jgi:hypothetical protein